MSSLIAAVFGLGVGIGSGWFAASAFFRLAKRLDWEEAAVEKYLEGDDAFVAAEVMAKRRELLDSGRSYPPRSDAGRPARVSRVRVRAARQKPADPRLGHF